MENKELTKTVAMILERVGQIEGTLAGITLLLANRVSGFEPKEIDILKSQSTTLLSSSKAIVSEAQRIQDDLSR